MITKQKRFDVIANALYKDIYRYAFWLCKNKAMAEDLVQETYLRAWKSFENLKDEKSVKAWLITILRRENARQYEKYQPPFDDISDLEIENPQQSTEQQLEIRILQQAILNLEVEFREPIMLQVNDGFSTDEIANILGLNKNTVLTRLFRARNKLKTTLLEKVEHRGASNG